MTIHHSVYGILENPYLTTHILPNHPTYTLDEIKAEIAIGEKQENEQQALVNRATELLKGMNFFMGYDTSKHEALEQLLRKGDFWLSLGKGQVERFPVKTWRKTLASQRAFIRLLEKAVVELENEKQPA